MQPDLAAPRLGVALDSIDPHARRPAAMRDREDRTDEIGRAEHAAVAQSP
jgi:hypothetical protein